jgi:hypothetical protein
MKRFGLLVLVLACVGVAGCDDDDGAAPSSLPVVFSALLSPANEIPAVSNAEASGRGAFQTTIVPTRDAAGTITAATANFHIQLYGFPAGVQVTASHIHAGTSNVNGPVRVDSGITLGQGITLADGTLELNIRGLTVDPAIAQAIINDPSAWYFNIHSTTNPGGFARGQLARVQ